MKKDIQTILRFIHENSSDYFIRDMGLVMQLQNLKAVMHSDKGMPEYIQISIKEGSIGAESIVSQAIETESVKDLVLDVWKRIESNSNSDFLNNHGSDEYHKFYQSVLDAISGKKENENFFLKVERENHSDVLMIDLTDKETEVTSCATLNYKDIKNQLIATGAVSINVCAAVKNIKDSEYQWTTGDFSVFIPSVELDKYPLLELSLNKKYSSENVLDYLLENLTFEESKKTLSVLKLKTELNDENSKVSKRVKV